MGRTYSRIGQCLHCGRTRKMRPRNLCFGCYLHPEIREKYPFVQHHACTRGIPDSYGPKPLPAEPTDAPPGSKWKVRVLKRRAKMQVQLHHPADSVGWETLDKFLDRLATEPKGYS